MNASIYAFGKATTRFIKLCYLTQLTALNNMVFWRWLKESREWVMMIHFSGAQPHAKWIQPVQKVTVFMTPKQ